MTAQGHPRAIFARAIERGNLIAAEASAREVGNLTLEEALRLLFLSAEKDPVKYDRAARRWLARYATEGKGVSLLKAQLAAASLAELRAGERQQAAKLLIGLAVPPREFGPGLPRPESQLDNSPATEDAPPLGRHE